MFKRPMDKFEGLSEDEIEERLNEFSKENFSKEDEKAMISAALKTFLPVVLAVCGLFGLFGLLISAWLG